MKTKLTIAAVAGAAVLLAGCSCMKPKADMPPPPPMPVKSNLKGMSSCKNACNARMNKKKASCSGARGSCAGARASCASGRGSGVQM